MSQDPIRRTNQPVKFQAQTGFQRRFIGSQADITIGGGAANCGKSYGSLLAAARWFAVRDYSAVFFRRTTKQVRAPGGLWDDSRKIYPFLGADANQTDLEWNWPSTARVKMAHLEHPDNIYDWQGAQIAQVLFDELTHFTEEMFFYMLSRNRSTCGVKGRVRATCNPDADSWVATLLEWWIEQDPESSAYGLPIPARAGVLRYMGRIGDELVWGDTKQEVKDRVPELDYEDIKSLTFVPGKIEDNKLGDPRYRGNLLLQSRVQRARLLDGNWKAKASAGEVFRRAEVRMIDGPPPESEVAVEARAWDLAATEASDTNKDPDFTAGVRIGRYKNGRYFVSDAIIVRKRSEDVRQLVMRTAENDTPRVKIALFKDPGQAGKDQAQSYVTMLAGFSVTAEPVTGDKETNAEPFSAQWQAGAVDVVRGPWNSLYFAQMEGFPSKGVHDDAVDASARAFKRAAKKEVEPANFDYEGGAILPRRY